MSFQASAGFLKTAFPKEIVSRTRPNYNRGLSNRPDPVRAFMKKLSVAFVIVSPTLLDATLPLIRACLAHPSLTTTVYAFASSDKRLGGAEDFFKNVES